MEMPGNIFLNNDCFSGTCSGVPHTENFYFVGRYHPAHYKGFTPWKRLHEYEGIPESGSEHTIITQGHGRMIIDSHTHIGTIHDFSITGDMLLRSMRRYGIGYALVSSVEGAEFDGGTRELEPWKPQITVNEEVAALARAHRHMMKGLFWIKPRREGWSHEVERFMTEHRDVMAGFKAHPSLSMLNITDERYVPYIRCAERMGLPFAVHSAPDEFSPPRAVYDTAQRFPGVNFIMVHMGLGTDNTKAARYIRELPNLYGDTSWVTAEHVLDAVRECGSGKILFGTDAPIDGEKTYGSYTGMIELLRRELSAHEFDDVFRGNALRLFRLEV